ncbi:hypothetical protein [Lentilactobacillus hilgardii]|uniref:hypothetical protein n=1 Tax=Lentilactobacillus hilgardii TaxID=1588 RepID=UPI0021A6F94E|nr:hypothetical protein [Lentilactobacillus hilgardii]
MNIHDIHLISIYCQLRAEAIRSDYRNVYKKTPLHSFYRKGTITRVTTQICAIKNDTSYSVPIDT